MRKSLALTILLLALGAAHAQQDLISVPLDTGWGATPEWCALEKAAKYDSSFQDGYVSLRASGGKGVMIWTRNPQPRLGVQRMGYVTLRYRATDIDPQLYSYLLYLDTGDSGNMYARNLIFGANDLIHDGQWHTITTQLHPFGEIGAIALRFRALEGKEGRLDVSYLGFSATPPRAPLQEALPYRVGDDGLGDFGIDLGDLANEDLPALQTALDLADWYPEEQAVINGVNFQVGLKWLVALGTKDDKKEALTVPVDARGAALYLLLGARFPYKMLGYAGWVPGDTTDRPEQFVAAIHYEDGTSEEQVPYCLSKRDYGIWRGLQTYCLPLNPGKTVKDFELRDGMIYSSFHLVAATMAGKCLAPAQPDLATRTPAGRGPWKMKPAVLRQGRAILVQGPWGEMAFGFAKGLALTAIENATHPEGALKVASRTPVFTIREGDQTWTSDDFSITDPSLEFAGARGQVHFAHEEAKLAATLTLEATPTEARLKLALANRSDQPRELRVTFPEVAVSHPRPQDAWYFYPTSSPVWSNADGAFDKAYSGWFPVQFADVYDRAKGGGVYIGTRDTSLRQRYYQLTKKAGLTRMAVEYRGNPPLPPGQTVEYPVSVIAPHGGDWKPAYGAYQAWVKTWYKPATPPVEWYRHVWNFRTWWTHTMGDGRAEYNLFDQQKGEYQTEAFLKRDRELYGQVDMIHFFDWRINKQYGEYGDFSHYEDIGGLDKFREAVQAIQRSGTRVGLYLDCYLCSHKSLIGQQHGQEWALVDRAGNLSGAYTTPEDPKWGMCVSHPGWQDHLAEACARAARDTGADGIYLDEGMTDLTEYWCWSKDHGHGVPAANQLGLVELARKTRAKLPPGVVLYTEWSPPDAMMPYLDGAYQANLAHCNIRQSPGFLQLARFAFPDKRLFTISNAGGMSDGIWEGTKYNLFSGVPLYTLSWGHDEEVYPLIRKMSKILHDHEAAFLTTTPKPFVDNERAGLYCNQFPGSKETVWTFWNARYRTVSGPVLKVRHVPGARYVDLWNERELRPVITKDGLAVITTTLGPRGIGAVAQVRK